MRLQSRVLLILGSLFTLLGLLTYFDSSVRLSQDYLEQDKKLAQTNMIRVQNALENTKQSLITYTAPWAQWDEAYAFLSKKDPRFIRSNFITGTFTGGKINFFLFFDEKGQLYYGKAYDLVKNNFIPLPEALIITLQENKKFVVHQNVDTRRAGLISIDNKLVLMSSLPVVTGEGNGPVHGSMLMGYYFSEDDAQNIGDIVKLTITPIPLQDAAKSKDYAKIMDALKSNPYTIDFVNDQHSFGYLYLKDIDQKPVMLLRVDLPRVLYNAGLVTTYHHYLMMLLLGVAILISIWFLIKKLIIDRIYSVAYQIKQLYQEGEFNKRITPMGKDEINDLILTINALLELIDLTQDQLKYRVSRRTRELEKISDLNRNLFTEIGLHRNAEAKYREEEKLLKKMAYYDALTGLPSRAFFLELLQKAILSADRGEKIAILFIDVDHFKSINDTYGHEFGDLYLKATAERIINLTGKFDACGRLAGDEMIMYLGNIENKAAIDASASKILARLSEPMLINQIKIQPSFSIGISLFPEDGSSIEELLRKADIAMYHAKSISGNTYQYYQAINDKNPISS